MTQATSSIVARYNRWQQARAIGEARQLARRLGFCLRWMDATGCSFKAAWRRSGSLLLPCDPR